MGAMSVAHGAGDGELLQLFGGRAAAPQLCWLHGTSWHLEPLLLYAFCWWQLQGTGAVWSFCASGPLLPTPLGWLSCGQPGAKCLGMWMAS